MFGVLFLLLFLTLLLCLLWKSPDHKLHLDQMDSQQLHAMTDEEEQEESKVSAPVFSRESGFYEQAFELTMEVPEGTTVYYTTDSSIPTTDSQCYISPLTIDDISSSENTNSMRTDFCPYRISPYYSGQQAIMDGYYVSYLQPKGLVDKCTVIRAIAVDAEGNCSDVVTASYFVDYENKTGYDNISVLSIVSDPTGLFSDESGIMVNGSIYKENIANGTLAGVSYMNDIRDYTNQYTLRGKDAERASYIDYFDEDGHKLVFSQNVGLRIHGNQSRVSTAHKSLNLYARKRYDGNTTFLSSFFEDSFLDNAVTLMRGNDIRNYYLSEKMNHRTMDSQNYRLVQVFLDGEYWGLYAIQERYASTNYMKNHYNLDEEDYSLLVGGPEGFDSKNGNEEISHTSFKMLREYISEHDASDPKVYEKICSMMDIQSFIDVYACKLYLGDQDWSWFKNQCISYFDNQWHWMSYDLDYTTGEYPRTVYDFDTFSSIRLAKSQSLSNDSFFPYLIKNESFRQDFVNTFLDLANETFKASNVSKDRSLFSEKYWDATMKDIDRYPIKGESAAIDEESKSSYYVRNFDEMLTFFENRFPYALSYMQQYLGISSASVQVSLHSSLPEGGKIQINTITPDLDEDGSWSGSYLSGYTISLTARPESGYYFVNWECDGAVIEDATSPSIQISLTGNVNISAVFQKK